MPVIVPYIGHNRSKILGPPTIFITHNRSHRPYRPHRPHSARQTQLSTRLSDRLWLDLRKKPLISKCCLQRIVVLPYCTQPRQCHLTVIRIIWCSRAAQSLPSKPCSRERGLEPRVSDTDSLVTRQGNALETPETVPELQYRYFCFRSLAIPFLPSSG